jgi:hypothetical protein
MQRVGRKVVTLIRKILVSSVDVTIDSKRMEVGDYRAMSMDRALGLRHKAKSFSSLLDQLIKARQQSSNFSRTDLDIRNC